MLYKDEAVVLKTMRLGEADRIITFVGRGQGKIRAVAKGVRKTKSRFGGRLEPFTHVSLVLWRGRSDLDIVNQADPIDAFREVREDLDRFALGQVMLEAVDRVVQEKEPASRVLGLLLDALKGLSASNSPLVLAWFLLKLSGVAGFAPSLDACTECGARATWFSPGQGGAVCGGCRDLAASHVPPGVLKLLHDLVTEGAWMKTDPEVVTAATRLARSYAEYHLERRLRSAVAGAALIKA
ncbi:MAG TPA: DNA repair protein RecO [Actinomycetota bacterium]|nr:DNA repair protein RecO [Actinomycetota bacterium]